MQGDEKKNTIEKWYNALRFPPQSGAAFRAALEREDLSDLDMVETYSFGKHSPQKDWLACLFFCDESERNYCEKRIPRQILLDTFSDLAVWCDTYYNTFGEWGIAEFPWLLHHYRLELFRLGRLQFCMGRAERDAPQAGLKEGDPVLEVHIPAGGRLTETACDDSLALAREFFGTFFPDFRYTYFTCHSWLLDEGLRNLLPCDSHILAFGNRFLRLHGEKSDAILRYLFKWNTTRQTLTGETPVSSFAAKVKNYALSGGDFYEVWGILRADG